jgi:hypothetical protein
MHMVLFDSETLFVLVSLLGECFSVTQKIVSLRQKVPSANYKKSATNLVIGFCENCH